MVKRKSKQRFHIILIKPSKYDDDGYVIRWRFAITNTSSLACLYALTIDVFEKGILGVDVEPVIHIFDDTVQKIPVHRLSRQILKAGERGIVCMVGVQTNQYARTLDLALEFKREWLPCMIGGFHVSGILAMIPERTPEIQEAVDARITLVAGEVEKKWGDLLKAAYEGRLEPIYNFMDEKPDLHGVPGPMLPKSAMSYFFNSQTSFDIGRGCPFKCSFCTIINVQGHTMRGRSVEDIEKMIRLNHARGFKWIFFTDDNFARQKDWEEIADRLIELKEKENIRCSLMIQTDTTAHRIPRFIEKMTQAGVRRVFMGLESVNPENLKAIGKTQNQIPEYRRMIQAWRDHGAIVISGYVLGFPQDTYESIMKDVEFLKKEIPLDLAEFYVLTPLPGSRDHQKYYLEGVPMAKDTNLYDAAHVTMEHPKMTKDELMRAYRDAWASFYSKEHCRTLLLRRKGPRRRILFSQLVWFCSSALLERIDPFLGGFYRRKNRKEKRRGYPVEPFFPFYWGRVKQFFVYLGGMAKLIWDLWLLKREADRPENAHYMDAAITPDQGKEEKRVLGSSVAIDPIASSDCKKFPS